jgi:hypothetical protein
MVASSVLLAGIGSFPSWKLGGTTGLWAMAAAGLICLPCALLSLIPLGYIIAKDMKDWWVQGALASMTLRMFTTLVFSFLASWLLPLPLIGFWVWVLIYYMLFLICETTMVIRIVNKGTPPAVSGPLGLRPQVGGGVS